MTTRRRLLTRHDYAAPQLGLIRMITVNRAESTVWVECDVPNDRDFWSAKQAAGVLFQKGRVDVYAYDWFAKLVHRRETPVPIPVHLQRPYAVTKLAEGVDGKAQKSARYGRRR